MADPPPPSYDDAITGDYSSPPPEPSSPPPPPSAPPPSSFPEQPETPVFYGETTSFSSGQDQPGTAVYSPTLLPTSSSGSDDQQGLRTSHVTVNVDNDGQHSGSESTKKRFKLAFFIVCVLAGCTILYLIIISPGSPKASKEDESISTGCKNYPPNVKGLEKFCPKNKHGVYDLGLSCEFYCPPDSFLFSQDMHRQRNQTFDNEKGRRHKKVYYQCKGPNKWVSSEVEDTEKFDCILKPSGPDDCKSPPPNVSNGRYTGCAKNRRGEYSNKTKCSFKCLGDTVLSSSKGYLGAEYLNRYETSGAYTCKKANWFSSGFSLVQYEDPTPNKKLKCLTITEFIKENIG